MVIKGFPPAEGRPARRGPALLAPVPCLAQQRLGYEHPFLGSSILILVMIFKIIINDNILTNDDNIVSLLYQYSGY